MYMFMYMYMFFHHRLCGGKEDEFSWHWADRKDYTNITVSQKMLSHHMPHALLDVLEKLVPDTPYTPYPNDTTQQVVA